MLHHSLVDNVTGRFHTFGEIGVASLLMVAKANNIARSEAAAREVIVTPLRSLPPHPDVKAGLNHLKQAGCRLISLTNSSNQGVKSQFDNAAMLDLFDDRYSVEDISHYKPDPRTYQWALEKAGVEPGEALLVAAHGWDIAGAKTAGLQAAFIQRQGKVLYPLAIAPDYQIKTLTELVSLL